MEKVSISRVEIRDNASSKAELYKILTVEWTLYITQFKFWFIDFMADIIEGKRKVSFIILMYIHTEIKSI